MRRDGTQADKKDFNCFLKTENMGLLINLAKWRKPQ